jgi:hypothetical protein
VKEDRFFFAELDIFCYEPVNLGIHGDEGKKEKFGK